MNDSPAENFSDLYAGERSAVIRTTDRNFFRQCRRKWAWGSHLRGNWGKVMPSAPLWVGTGFHFAYEDAHGHQMYDHPAIAFEAYVAATEKYARLRNGGDDDGLSHLLRLPPDYKEQARLACDMLEYYWDKWLLGRDPLKTFVYNGQPQLEVNARVELPWEPGKFGLDKVYYSLTLDRIVHDPLDPTSNRIYILELKTAKQFETLHLPYDPQVSAYSWAGSVLYPGYEVCGVIYQQHLKAVPQDPRVLKSGELSTDKRQKLSHRSLRDVLIKRYGKVDDAPSVYIEWLNMLARTEDENQDPFVRRDTVRRNAHQIQAEGVKILMEAEEMLNPDFPLYPAPDRQCAYMCDFTSPCVSMDDGSDWEFELLETGEYEQRSTSYDQWRDLLELPGERTDHDYALDADFLVQQPNK